MPKYDVELANKAAKDAGMKWPDGRKAFHDWLENSYWHEKEGQSYEWLRRKAQEFLNAFPKYRA